MPLALLARNWDYLRQNYRMPVDVVPVDITETAKWFFEEDDTDYRHYREDFPCVLSPSPVAWFEFPAPQWSNNNGQLIRMPTLPGLRYGFFVQVEEVREEGHVEALRQDALLAEVERSGQVYVMPHMRAQRQETIDYYRDVYVAPTASCRVGCSPSPSSRATMSTFGRASRRSSTSTAPAAS